MKRFDLRTIAAVCITLVFWASAFAAIRYALQTYTPGHVALLRFIIASVLLGGYAVITRMRLPHRKDLPGIFLLGVLGFSIYHAALCYGETRVLAGTASLLIASSPIMTALLSVFFLKERFTPLQWLGILVGFSGVALTTMENGSGWQFNSYALYILLAAFSVSIYFVFQKPFHSKYSVVELTTYTILSGTLVLLIYLPGIGKAVLTSPWQNTLAMIYLGIFPTVIAFLTWNYTLTRISAANASTFLYFSPLLAVAIAWVWLGEIPSILTLAGGVVITLGVILVNRQKH